MIVSRNGVVSPTIELSTGVRRIHLFRISLWRVVVMSFACPFDLAWSKASYRLLLPTSIFVQSKFISSWSDLARYLYTWQWPLPTSLAGISPAAKPHHNKRGKRKII